MELSLLPFIRIQITAKKGNLVKRLRTLTTELVSEYLLIETKVRCSWQKVWVSLDAADYLWENITNVFSKNANVDTKLTSQSTMPNEKTSTFSSYLLPFIISGAIQ